MQRPLSPRTNLGHPIGYLPVHLRLLTYPLDRMIPVNFPSKYCFRNQLFICGLFIAGECWDKFSQRLKDQLFIVLLLTVEKDPEQNIWKKPFDGILSLKLLMSITWSIKNRTSPNFDRRVFSIHFVRAALQLEEEGIIRCG